MPVLKAAIAVSSSFAVQMAFVEALACAPMNQIVTLGNAAATISAPMIVILPPALLLESLWAA